MHIHCNLCLYNKAAHWYFFKLSILYQNNYLELKKLIFFKHFNVTTEFSE